jgi:hypothetical protein
MEHYKAEHQTLLKEDRTNRTALWTAKLDEKEDNNSNLKVPAKKSQD